MILRSIAWVVTALALAISVPHEGPQEGEKPGAPKPIARERFDALVKAWTDARFWIHSHGARIGWQRYQVRWVEVDGEKLLVVEFDRATTLNGGDRFTAWLEPDEFLSPRAVRWGDSWFELSVKNGMIGPPGFPGKPAPDSLSLFPEFLAALRLPKEDAELAFNLLDTGSRDAAAGQMKGMGQEKTPGSPKEIVPTHKIKVTSKGARTIEETMWIRDDLTMARFKLSISSPGRRPQVEEFVPVDAKEWSQVDLASNEIRAAALLSQLASLNAHFRASDFDENSSIDFWSGDVSGLYRLIPPKQEKPLAIISKELALADASPLPAGPIKGGGTISDALGPKPVPLHGYLFKALSKGRVRKEPYPLNDGSNRNQDMFGFCAYPAEYGKTGRRTVFLTEDNAPYWKDLNGKPISDVPADLEGEGWKWAGLRN